MRPAPFVSLSFLFGNFLTSEAANPIFGAFATPACEACLDAAFANCPGDYKTRKYAECMCAGIGGQGGRDAGSCAAQQCDDSLNEPTNMNIARGTYCVSILKEACPYYVDSLPQSVYEKYCSPGNTQTAIATKTTTGGATRSLVPTIIRSETEAAAPSQSKSASFGTATAVPAWLAIVGMFAQGMLLQL